jgi:nicotinate-nucleotide pyrophosphorylase (carboxylating)
MDFLELLVQKAFLEDFVHEDITSVACIPEGQRGVGKLLLKQDGVIAGLKFLPQIFQRLDPHISSELHVQEGTLCKKGTYLATFKGPAQALLSAERTALNLLQHLSGIATLTALCVEKVKGTRCKILDTRKTLPGYRQLQKYAVQMGGGQNHRIHLADQILIKNNHLFFTPLADSIRRAKERYPGQKIEVEIGRFEDLEIALASGANALLLDNMSPSEVKRCVEFVSGRAFLEASGGITLTTLQEYAQTGVDAISLGALTHSAPALDIAFRIRSEYDAHNL